MTPPQQSGTGTQWRERDPAAYRAYMKRYEAERAANPAYWAEKLRKDRERRKLNKRKVLIDPVKEAARQKARRSIKKGILERKPCEVCGNPNVDAHHDDYSKPLQVRFLCRKHHRQVHAKSKYDYAIR